MAKNNLDRVFQDLRRSHKKALIAYLAAGYPRFSEEEKLIEVLSECGVDILELGIPFSDPIADGPTIQFASQESLKNGTTLKKIIKWIERLKGKVNLPIVIMSYMNPLMNYGFDKFSDDAKKAGVSGVIIPDLIPEEGEEMANTLARNNIHLIYLVAPTTPPDRQKMIARKTKGFLYAVSVTGVTGARKKFDPGISQWLSHLKKISQQPVCVGFGISGRDQVRQLKKNVDGFIVGSALIDKIRTNPSSKRKIEIGRFVGPLVKECHDGR